MVALVIRNRFEGGRLNVECVKLMGKVSFDIGIDSVRGVLMRSDPFYIRRYKRKDGTVQYIVQARPNRSNHKATPKETANRAAFGKRYGTDRKRKKE